MAGRSAITQLETGINAGCHWRSVAMQHYWRIIYRQYASYHELGWSIDSFDRLAEHLTAKALVCIYGPFNYNGAYTSDSNARFDQWLKSQNTLSGIRDFEDILFLATARGLSLMSDNALPANNRLLVLQNNWEPWPDQLLF